MDSTIAPFALRDYILADNRGYKRSEVGGGWEAYASKLESRDSVVRTSSVSFSQRLWLHANELTSTLYAAGQGALR